LKHHPNFKGSTPKNGLQAIKHECYITNKIGGVLKSMLTLNEAIIDVKEG